MPIILTILIFIIGAFIASAAIIHFIDWYKKVLWVLSSALIVVAGFIGYALSGVTIKIVFACTNLGRGFRVQRFLKR